MARGSSSSIRIFLLGRFEITHGERILRNSDWTRRKAATLFQRVALEHHLTKDQAIDFLWSNADPDAGANNLYRTLHTLRQTLDTTLGAGSADATLTFEDGVLGLCESTWVDVHQFEQLATASPADSPQQCIEKYNQALALYAGDLLPNDLYSDWLQVPRDALRRLYRETVLALVTHYRETHDSARVIALLTQLLARDPADEFAHRELMRAYALAGRRHEALRQYQLCLDALAKELDVPPEPETSALYSQILSGELTPTLVQPVALPALITAEVEQGIPLVGRETEAETLRAHCLVRLYAALARNRLEAGELDAADHALALGLEMSQRHGHCTSCDALLLPAAVSVRVRQGNLQEAEVFCNQLEEASVKYASRIWVAMARQARAELAAAQSRLDQAVLWYHEAYENFTIAGNDYEAARCLSASSELRLRRHAPRDDFIAQEAQTEARKIYARLGVG